MFRLQSCSASKYKDETKVMYVAGESVLSKIDCWVNQNISLLVGQVTWNKR